MKPVFANKIYHGHSRSGPYAVLICILSFFLAFVLTGCQNISEVPVNTLFQLSDSSHTHIRFKNELKYAYEFNIYRYRNFYNGGGVALGDINNDGLIDIYLTGNQVPNKLYLNKGDFEFLDITNQSGVAGERAWSTGVSMADINGDGWLDIYVCNSGLVDGDDKKNELYINNGDTTFTEMAEEYGIADPGLSTHGSFFDYDKDGDLDLYLVNNSYRSIGSFNLQHNTRNLRHPAGGDKLFRNELVPGSSGKPAAIKPPADSTRETPFPIPAAGTEEGKGDGSPDNDNGSDTPATEEGDGEGACDRTAGNSPGFTDVSEQAGIYGSEIGFGLGVSVGDVNGDGWPDMYVSNDFFERDYLYLNNHDGTFKEVLEESVKSISAAAMGADMADFNGDGFPEIFVTDMLPNEEARIKTVTSFDSWERYQNYITDDYYHQFTRNTLQLNRGSVPPGEGGNMKEIPVPPAVRFTEIGRLAGVEASDWSWGAMIADYNLDGYRDIFVANGIYRDLTNADYLVDIRDVNTFKALTKGNDVNFRKLIDMIPSNPISNYLFAGDKSLAFVDSTAEWGLSEPGFSNGSAYGDLDNDGDLDLVVNNVNRETFVYRSRVTEFHPERAWLQIELKGRPPNTFAVGAQVTVWSGGRRWYAEQQPVRGFQSTVDHTMHLGLGSVPVLDSLAVRWPDGSVTTRTKIATHRRLKITQPAGGLAAASPGITDVPGKGVNSGAERITFPELQGEGVQRTNGHPLMKRLNPSAIGLDWTHQENTYNDFNRQPLLFHMRSTEGPAMCVGDANGDGREDIYVGGAKDQPGAIFIQKGASFIRLDETALGQDRLSEDTDCTWFDADGDGDQDLYVASGGSEFPASSSALMDRLYFNDGRGRLRRSDQLLIAATRGFEPTGTVAASDYDGDGDVDLFTGTRLRPFAYGVPVDGHLLVNNGAGNFTEATDSLAPGLRELGLITGAEWADVNSDGQPELVIAGEWMPLTIFENKQGRLVDGTASAGLGSTSGWWNAVALFDLDGDGDLDLIGANHGLNSRFQASPDQPVQIWTGDFDGNGTIEQVIATFHEQQSYPMALRHDLLDQIPSLKAKYPSYESYAGQTVQDIFTGEELNSAIYRRAEQLQSIVGWNDGEGQFRIEPLPQEAQLAPMYGIQIADIHADGTAEVFMGGNLYDAKPEVGRYDASYGVAMEADSSGRLQALPFSESGFWVNGQIRNLAMLEAGGRQLLIVARNQGSIEVFTFEH